MRPPVPYSAIVAVIGWSDPSAASPFPWWGARPRVGVLIWSSLLVEWRRSPLVPRGSGGSPIHEGHLAWIGRTKALPRQRCSNWPERTVGDRSPYPWCCAGPDGRDPGHRSPVYVHRTQCGASSTLAQSVDGAATIVVVPRRAPVRAQGYPHEGSEGCESARTLLPPMAVPKSPP